MNAHRYEPYTPPRLVPNWAMKITSAPKVETPQKSRQPPPNAPKAPAAMSPALPHNVRGRQGGQRRNTKWKSPSSPAVAIIDFANSTPTFQKYQPVVDPSYGNIPTKSDEEIEREEDEGLLRECMEVALRWDPLEIKEFIPQRLVPKDGGRQKLEISGNNSQGSNSVSKQDHGDCTPFYPRHLRNKVPFAKEIDLDELEERKRQFRRYFFSTITPIGCTPGERRNISSMFAKREVDTFEYSPIQRKVDYANLLHSSEVDTVDPVYGLSYAPKFDIWSHWRDDFTDRYLHAMRSEHAYLSNLLDEAFEVVQKSGFDMEAEGLEEVKRMVEVGHDFSELGAYRFNEHMSSRTRSRMMRHAGAWRRINLSGEKAWFTED